MKYLINAMRKLPYLPKDLNVLVQKTKEDIQFIPFLHPPPQVKNPIITVTMEAIIKN